MAMLCFSTGCWALRLRGEEAPVLQAPVIKHTLVAAPPRVRFAAHVCFTIGSQGLNCSVGQDNACC